MGVSNKETHSTLRSRVKDTGPFSLDDSSDSEDDSWDEEEIKRTDKALDNDIDEKVQFWIDCIQGSAPGASILIVASFDDHFDNKNEAKKRCKKMHDRLLCNENRRKEGLQNRLNELKQSHSADAEVAKHTRMLLYTRPKLLLGSDNGENVIRVSSTNYIGFSSLAEKMINIATGQDRCGYTYPLFRGHVVSYFCFFSLFLNCKYIFLFLLLRRKKNVNNKKI